MHQPLPAMAEKIVKAAELFADRGLDATKTDGISAITGIPKATIYYYFEGKEQILSLIFGAVSDAAEEVIVPAVNCLGQASDRLQAAINNHLQVFRDYPEASQALHFDLGLATRLAEVSSRSNSAFIDPICALLEEGRQDGSLRPVGDPRLTDVAIRGAITTSSIHVTAIDRSRPMEELDRTKGSLLMQGLFTEMRRD